MLEHTIDGHALLSHFTALMGAGNRRGAQAYRNALPDPELKAFVGTLLTPWIRNGAAERRVWACVISFTITDPSGTVEMIRDLAQIAARHQCELRLQLDERTQTGQLTLCRASEPVRRVLVDWLSGYATILQQAQVDVLASLH